MRLLFKFTPIDPAAFLKATEKHGVGAVQSGLRYMVQVGTTKVEERDAIGAIVRNEDGTPKMIDAPVLQEQRRIAFDFIRGEESGADKVRKIAENSGLEFDVVDEAAGVCTKSAPALLPKAG